MKLKYLILLLIIIFIPTKVFAAGDILVSSTNINIVRGYS